MSANPSSFSSPYTPHIQEHRGPFLHHHQNRSLSSTPCSPPNTGSLSGRSARSGVCTRSQTKNSRTYGAPSRISRGSCLSISSKATDSFVVAVVEGRGAGAEVGMCFCDLKTSEVILCQIADSQTYVRTLQKLNLYEPSEILVPNTAMDPVNSKLVNIIKENIPSSIIIPVARRLFNDSVGLQYINKYIIKEDSASLLLDIPTKYFCLAATAAVMHHIEETRNATFLNHTVLFKYQICQGSMIVDSATARNLELTINLSSRNDKETLFGILNATMTPMGSRLLRSNILQPLTDEKAINTRLDCVQELSQAEDTFYALRSSLKAIKDVDHLITSFIQVPAKLSVKHSEQSINHIINLKHTLQSIRKVAEAMHSCQNRLLKTVHRLLTDFRLRKLGDLIDSVIEQNMVQEKTPVGLRNQRCFAVKAGCNGLLDVARQTYKETINDIFEAVNRYVEEYNINLKVQFSMTMGYYLSTSVDRLEVGMLPLIFINVVKKNKILIFTTLELMKKNAKINDSLTEVYLMSDKIVSDLSSSIRSKIGALYNASEAVAMIDMLLSFAYILTVNNYVRPEFTDMIVIKQGRHPIIEKLYSAPFVANDTYASSANTFQIITGPNMSGKSTYLRQVALLTVMAQIGSFVPAEYAAFRIMHRLFSRICNDDSIELNASTFMMEMKETAYILQNVNKNSLVVIDELGRGTSIYDGLGIAFAVCEELIHTHALVLFATHFHELTSSLTVYHNVINLHLETELKCDGRDTSGIVYKYCLSTGSAEETHYGLSLARTLQLSEDITTRAEHVSIKLTYLQENAWHQSENSKVVARRRALAQIAHNVVVIQQCSNGMTQQDLVLALRDAQGKAISQMLAIRRSSAGLGHQ